LWSHAIGHGAQKPWRVDQGETASMIVWYETNARARIRAIEIVEKIADVPQAI